jgi:hypothetical protein
MKAIRKVVVLVGVPGIPKDVDWSAIFAQELTVAAAYTYHRAEQWRGQTAAHSILHWS